MVAASSSQRVPVSVSIARPTVVVDTVDGQWYAIVSDGTSQVKVVDWPLRDQQFDADSSTVISIQLYLAEDELQFLRGQGQCFAEVHVPAAEVMQMQKGGVFQSWCGLQRGRRHGEVGAELATQLFKAGQILAQNLLTPKLCCSIVDAACPIARDGPRPCGGSCDKRGEEPQGGACRWEAMLRQSVAEHGSIISKMHQQLKLLFSQGRLVCDEHFVVRILDDGDEHSAQEREPLAADAEVEEKMLQLQDQNERLHQQLRESEEHLQEMRERLEVLQKDCDRTAGLQHEVEALRQWHSAQQQQEQHQPKQPVRVVNGGLGCAAPSSAPQEQDWKSRCQQLQSELDEATRTIRLLQTMQHVDEVAPTEGKSFAPQDDVYGTANESIETSKGDAPLEGDEAPTQADAVSVKSAAARDFSSAALVKELQELRRDRHLLRAQLDGKQEVHAGREADGNELGNSHRRKHESVVTAAGTVGNSAAEGVIHGGSATVAPVGPGSYAPQRVFSASDIQRTGFRRPPPSALVQSSVLNSNPRRGVGAGGSSGSSSGSGSSNSNLHALAPRARSTETVRTPLSSRPVAPVLAPSTPTAAAPKLTGTYPGSPVLSVRQLSPGPSANTTGVNLRQQQPVPVSNAAGGLSVRQHSPAPGVNMRQASPMSSTSTGDGKILRPGTISVAPAPMTQASGSLSPSPTSRNVSSGGAIPLRQRLPPGTGRPMLRQ